MAPKILMMGPKFLSLLVFPLFFSLLTDSLEYALWDGEATYFFFPLTLRNRPKPQRHGCFPPSHLKKKSATPSQHHLFVLAVSSFLFLS